MLMPKRPKYRKHHRGRMKGRASQGVTRRPAETRMGKGKGPVDHWVAVVKPGRILFEITGVSEREAKEAMRRASHKLPIKTRFVTREKWV